jgi:hypothetical protein
VETWEQRRDRLLRTLPFYGDVEALPAVAGALAAAPAVVAEYVVERCVLIVSGRSTGGWTAGPLPADRFPIVLDGHVSDRELKHYTLHEAAHRFTLPAPAECATAQEVVRVRAKAPAWTRELEARKAEDEDIAELLTAAWSAAPP